MKTKHVFFFSSFAAIFLFAACIKAYIPIPHPPATGLSSTNGTDPQDSVYVVSTLAGSGTAGFADGTGTAASFWVPSSVVVDANGNLYVNDYGNNAIRKITPAGVVTTFAGTGQSGNNDGPGAAATFSGPEAVAIDPSGNIYVSEWYNNDIRKITPSGVVSTFAGSLSYGYTDATGTAAKFYHLTAITCDGQGNLYVFDDYNNHIRKITAAAVVSTFVGTGVAGKVDGTGTSASIGDVNGICTDASNNVYLADALYNTVRKATPAAVVTTIAGRGNPDILLDADGVGTQASFSGPYAIGADKYGNLYVGDCAIGSSTIRKVTPAGVVTTIAGIPGTQGSADGPGHQATFGNPIALTVDSNGVIYVCDGTNNNIRKLTPQR